MIHLANSFRIRSPLYNLSDYIYFPVFMVRLCLKRTLHKLCAVLCSQHLQKWIITVWCHIFLNCQMCLIHFDSARTYESSQSLKSWNYNNVILCMYFSILVSFVIKAMKMIVVG